MGDVFGWFPLVIALRVVFPFNEVFGLVVDPLLFEDFLDFIFLWAFNLCFVLIAKLGHDIPFRVLKK